MKARKEDIEKIDRLKKRSDFLRVQREGRRWVSPSVIVQASKNKGEGLRFGLTVSKRVHKTAVRRNRVKRRLRAAAYDILGGSRNQDKDYVLIGRPETLEKTYTELCADLRWCLKRLEAPVSEEAGTTRQGKEEKR